MCVMCDMFLFVPASMLNDICFNNFYIWAFIIAFCYNPINKRVTWCIYFFILAVRKTCLKLYGT